MYIQLIRNQPQGKAIFGQLYVDGEYFCDTLENTDYAIPTGFYRLRVTMSPRFKIFLPILDGVWGYRGSGVEGSGVTSKHLNSKASELRSTKRTGIRIHAGNNIDHTEGCILVGEADLPNLRLLSSLKTLHRLCDVLLNYQNHNPYEEMYIEISEPDPYPLYDVMCPPELQQHALDARYELKRQRDLRTREN
jgi:hypothetical protein